MRDRRIGKEAGRDDAAAGGALEPRQVVANDSEIVEADVSKLREIVGLSVCSGSDSVTPCPSTAFPLTPQQRTHSWRERHGGPVP